MATQRPRMPTHAISLRPAPGSKTTSAGSQASRQLAIRLSRRICKEAVSLDHNRHDRSLLVHAIRYYPALAVDRQGSVTAAIGPSPRIQAQSAWAMASLLGASSPLGARVCGATGMQIDSAARFRGGGRYENFRMVDGRGTRILLTFTATWGPSS
jgi:hypothetical protein